MKDRKVLRPKQAADYLGMHRSTLAKWRKRRKGPRYHRTGERLIYYFQDEIDAWLERCDERTLQPIDPAAEPQEQ